MRHHNRDDGSPKAPNLPIGGITLQGIQLTTERAGQIGEDPEEGRGGSARLEDDIEFESIGLPISQSSQPGIGLSRAYAMRGRGTRHLLN